MNSIASHDEDNSMMLGTRRSTRSSAKMPLKKIIAVAFPRARRDHGAQERTRTSTAFTTGT
jgi:hypothetical protein